MIYKKLLKLDLDALHEQEFFQSKLDINESGHTIIIDVNDREKLLDEVAAEFRKRAENLLEHPHTEE